MVMLCIAEEKNPKNLLTNQLEILDNIEFILTSVD